MMGIETKVATTMVKVVRTLTYYGPKWWVDATLHKSIKDRLDLGLDSTILESRVELIPTAFELERVFKQENKEIKKTWRKGT